MRNIAGVVVIDMMADRTPELEDVDRLCQALVDREGTHRVVLNMSALGFPTSTLISRVLSVKQRIDRRDGTLVLCGLRAIFRDVFAYTRLDTLFDIFEGETTAIEVLRRG
jgi:anti-anti-sigma factor